MLWKDWSISRHNAVKNILIKLQSQGDNHAQADYNHAKAEDCKVDLYSMEQRCLRIEVIYTRNAVEYKSDQITISGRSQPRPSRRQQHQSRQPEGERVFNWTKELWKDWSISRHNAVKNILMKLQSQADNHAQADYNHAKADNRKVNVYSIEQRCYERIEVYLDIVP
jgi:hypothetical protein